jgi:uncharacterized membrane protein YsdA (DUF1294 family)
MKNPLRFTNLSIGIAVVILFAITGQLMRHYYLNETAPDVERMFRRSRHLYLLLIGLTQGGIGIYIAAYQHKLAHRLQWLATAVMTLSAALLIYAFFYEIPHTIIKTNVSRIALFMLLGSVTIHLGSSVISSFKSKTN